MAESAPSDVPPATAVVYLDIDGVLQPLSSRSRFEHDMKAYKQGLVQRVDPRYAELNRYDLAAVRYDWHPAAVANLKTLCAQGEAKIVISSSWREERTLEQLRLLFHIHDLGALVVDRTPLLGARDREIQEHLAAHPEIERFVVLDDSFAGELGRAFERRFVLTSDHLDAEALERALAALRIVRGEGHPAAPGV